MSPFGAFWLELMSENQCSNGKCPVWIREEWGMSIPKQRTLFPRLFLVAVFMQVWFTALSLL